MDKFVIVPATGHEARLLAPNLRKVDVDEVWASAGLLPLEALLESIELSDPDMCWAALLNGVPVAVFGASCLDAEQRMGSIWLLASDGIYASRKDFMSKCRGYLNLMHTRYRTLGNFIDERNKITQRWLERLGFTRARTYKNFGDGGLPFTYYFSHRG